MTGLITAAEGILWRAGVIVATSLAVSWLLERLWGKS